MSTEQDKNFLDLITEYAKATNLDVNMDEVKEAFPEYYKDGAVFKQKEEESLFEEPINAPKLEKEYGQQKVENLQTEVKELRKIIQSHEVLLAEMKLEVKSKTPAVDSALLKQRLDTFQKMYFDLEERLEANEQAVLHTVKEEAPQKKRAWWMPIFLFLTLLILSILLFLLWKQTKMTSTQGQTNTNISSKINEGATSVNEPETEIDLGTNTQTNVVDDKLVSEEEMPEASVGGATSLITNKEDVAKPEKSDNSTDNKSTVVEAAKKKAVKPTIKKKAATVTRANKTVNKPSKPKPRTTKAQNNKVVKPEETPAVYFK